MWSRVLVFAVLFLYAAPSVAAVTFDAATMGECNGCSSLSFSHTAATGSNRSITVAMQEFEAAGCCDNITGITYNSIALTQQCTYQTAASTPRKVVEFWYLANNATGANTVAVTASGTLSHISAGAVTATDVNQTTPLGACNNATGTSTAPSVNVTSTTGNLVVDSGVIDNTGGSLTVGAGQTWRWEGYDGGGSIQKFGSTEPGATTTTMSWSYSAGTPSWIIAGVSIQQVVSTATTKTLLLLGVGQ